ncbi:MAG: HEAT repeat domain-containing protein [Sedimentisphaerales bacterium]|nr:HEAT repeat domain-containing protein [Sedimentisphaerales bacterium]
MKIRITILIMAAALGFTAASAAVVETEKLLKNIDTLKTYKYGSSGGVDLRWVEQQVAMASKNDEIRREVETKLMEALAGATTNDARQFFCRQLRTIGTARCVAQLESMLPDPEISHMARYALGRIDTREAGKALHRGLDKTSGKLKAGIINTLVQIEYSTALPDILKLVGDADKDVATAAIRAVGHFGGIEALTALSRQRTSANKELQLEIDSALLDCAGKFAADGNSRQAVELYEAFYKGKYPEHIRLAGLRGLAAAGGENATALLVEAIKGDDPALRRNAIAMMALMKGKETTDTFVSLSKSLPADGQELIVRSLAERGDVSAVPAIIEMTGNENENVRLAALEALGGLGTPQAVRHLAEAAATGSEQEKQVARASLLRITGDGVEKAIADAAVSGDAAGRVEVIRAIGQRGKAGPFSILLKLALADEDEAVRREAILSMARIGSPENLDVIVKLAITAKAPDDRSAVERAVVIMFSKMEDRDRQAQAVIDVLNKAPNDAKPVLLKLLSRPATDQAFEAVKAALDSRYAEVSDAAIRALGEWPNAAPAEQVYQIAQTSGNPTQKLLALRSYIRMASLMRDPMSAYVKALKLSSRDEEIRLILGGLHNAGTAEALDMGWKYTTVESLKPEAYMAIVKVANVYCWQDPEGAKAALDKVIAEAPNDGIRNQARDVIKKMDRYKGFIVAWRGAGPYTIASVNDGRTVFDKEFAPETDADAKDIVWQVIQPEFEGDNRINLEKTFGGIDYCCAYLRTIVDSPGDLEARIRWSADDYIKGWMNGEPTGEGNIKLRKGANTLMLKVGDHAGGWSFRCQLTKPDGSGLDGLRFEPR